MKIYRILTAAAVATTAGMMLLVLPALAHHATGPFYDPEKVVDLQGTVTRFVFRNPHAFLFIDVPDQNGQNSEWQIELGAPVGLRRIGWTPDTLPVGMEVQLTGRGSRAEASQGVCCVRMTRADGSPVLVGGAASERTQD